MAGIRLKAPAKLNIHLGVHAELDERRYHRVDSLMVSLDLCDEVRVWAHGRHAGLPEIVCNPPLDIAPERNTCYKAAVRLGELTGNAAAVRVEVDKHVPDQAGLGGSSSDAASTLIALADLWGIEREDPRLFEAARATGADVPFFLDGAPALLAGAGDVFQETFPRPEDPIPVVLVRPRGPGVSTPAAYAAFDEGRVEPTDPEPLCAVLRAGRYTATTIAPLLANNLDPIACRLHPGVAQVRTWLLGQDGVIAGQVTGSGSCVFGLCRSEEAAETIARRAHMKFGSWAKSAHIV